MEQEANLKGHTEAKRLLREAMELKILLVANAAAAYARSNGHALLLAELDYAPTDLERSSEQRIDDVAVRVHNAATVILPLLGVYGITLTEMDDLTNARIAYDSAKTMPDVKRAMRKAMTETLQPMFDDTSGFLKGQMDLLMVYYQTSFPEFFAGYKAARVIMDLHGPGTEEEEPDPAPVP